MNLFPWLRPALVWLLLSNCPAWAQYDPVFKEYHEPMRAYGWVEFGGAQVQDFDATLGGTTLEGRWEQEMSARLSPGFAVNGGIGETLSRWVSVEVLAGFLYNNVDDLNSAAGTVGPVDGALTQVPLLLNLVVRVPVSERFQPFLGAGAGAVISWWDVDQAVLVSEGQLLELEGSSTEYTFAYQFFGGLSFRLRPEARVTLTYRFQGSTGPTWSLEEAAGGDAVAALEAEELVTHSLTLGFQVSL